jgi:hypothetical protein
MNRKKTFEISFLPSNNFFSFSPSSAAKSLLLLLFYHFSSLHFASFDCGRIRKSAKKYNSSK